MFRSREDAALSLTRIILKEVKDKNLLVLGLTRGGAVVAKVISQFLEAPFDILVVKKIGAPLNPELAIGAVAPGTVYWNETLCKELRITTDDRKKLRTYKDKERRAQEKELRQGKQSLDINDKTVILVDDGVATGATVVVAGNYLKKKGAKKVILAVPVVSKDTYRDIKKYFDRVIALRTERDFMAVGQFYDYFPQVTNEEVQNLL